MAAIKVFEPSDAEVAAAMAVDVGLGGRAIVEPPDSSSTWRFA